MEEALNKVQVELREERLARHKLEGRWGVSSVTINTWVQLETNENSVRAIFSNG